MDFNDPLDVAEARLRILQSRIKMELAKIKLARAARKTAESFDRFGMTLSVHEFKDMDLREFDNRAHDWLRS